MSDIKNDEYINYKNDHRIVEIEKEYLQKRTAKETSTNPKVCGLALSGGGIRSASFSLGVLQALAKRDCLKKFDYLSTVSGGGYIGSSLSWFLHKKWKYIENSKETIQFGVEAENFPFGTQPNREKDEPGAGSREKMSIMRHLRQNINYMFPGEGIGPAALFSAIVRGFVVNIMVYLPMLLLTLAGLAYFASNGVNFASLEAMTTVNLRNPTFEMEDLSTYLIVACYIVGLNIGILVLYCFVSPFIAALKKPDLLYSVHRMLLRNTSLLWMLAICFALIGMLPMVLEMLAALTNGNEAETSAGITMSGLITGVWAFIRTGSTKKPVIKIPTKLLITLAAALLVYGILLLAYVIDDSIFGEDSIALDYFDGNNFYYVFLFLPVAIGFFININYISLHGYYRDRLMELFLPKANKTTINKPAHPANLANVKLLKDICAYDKESVGPYHLINTNVVLPGSKITKFKGRGGDSFLLSPLYCGSSATGWRTTDKFNNGKMTLASAMAISGAAVNPATGAGGEGPTTNYFLSIIMSILNFRLGVWVENPRVSISKIKLQPNLWFPGLRGWLLSNRLNEKSPYIELSDGGHFENLGVYELVRRKVEVIVVCDGAADKNYCFSDFTNLVEKIRLDFGAKVDIDLDPLIPEEGDHHEYGLEKLAKQGYAIGNITYNDDKTAYLIYMKTTLIPGLPADIYGYKMKHDDYPDESTGDQVFNEKQFEAYRELGYQICKNMLNSRSSATKRLIGC